MKKVGLIAILFTVVMLFAFGCDVIETPDKQDITGVTFVGAEVAYTGNEQLIEVSGTIPNGVQVSYEQNKGTNAGTYNATATLSGENYNTLKLTATLKIEQSLTLYLKLAENMLSYLFEKPDPYTFLPDTLKLENKKHTGATTMDYTNFVAVSAIPTNGIGEQLNVVYESLNTFDSVFGKVTTYYGYAAQLLTLYKNYLTTSPETPAQFSAKLGDFTFDLNLTNTAIKVVATFNTIKIESVATTTGASVSYSGRVQLNDANAIKFEVTPDSLTMAIRAAGINRSMMSFKTGEAGFYQGSIYMYYGISPVAITKQVEIRGNATQTTVAGERGEFYAAATKKRNVETYNNTTGKLVGAKVFEATSAITFNTAWYPLTSISGVTNIKFATNEEKEIDLYLNNSTTAFADKNVGGLSLKFGSRRYDIELRKEYFYTYDNSTEKYTQVEMLIPRLFIQEENEPDLFKDITAQNKSLTLGYGANLPKGHRDVIASNYTIMLEIYNSAKQISPEDVLTYIGTSL